MTELESTKNLALYDNHHGKCEWRDKTVGKIESDKRRKIVEPRLAEFKSKVKAITGISPKIEISGSVGANMATIESDTDIFIKLPLLTSRSKASQIAEKAIALETSIMVDSGEEVDIKVLKLTVKGWKFVGNRLAAMGF